MSCSSSPSPPPFEHSDDGRTRAPALDLLDEYWFFSNTLVTNNSAKKKKKTPPRLPRSPSTSTGTGGDEKASRLGVTMELPLPTNKLKDEEDDRLLVHEDGDCRAGAAACSSSGNQQPQAAAADEVDDDDLNWSSIYEGVLRTRMTEGGGRSALRRAPSMPVVPSSATATDRQHGHGDGDGRRQTKSTPSMPRLLRHSHSTLGRHTPPTVTKQPGAEQRTPGAVARCSKKHQDNKWKSSIEVQGFKDLGFVFDKEDVLPGLKQQSQMISTTTRWPYLSSEVRRPALARVQSAAEIKDQLRMWAQAVACNVRHDC